MLHFFKELNFWELKLHVELKFNELKLQISGKLLNILQIVIYY